MNQWHSDFVGVYENIFPSDLCDQIIKLASQHELLPRHPKEGGSLIKHDFGNNINNFQKNFTNEITYHLKLCIDKYTNKYPFFKHYFPLIPTGYQYQSTPPTGGYHIWHAESVGLKHRNRVAVWTLYLNDINEGGETEFLYQSLRIPPKKGTICIFPAGYTHLHRGNPPLSKTKHIITGWIEYVELENIETNKK